MKRILEQDLLLGQYHGQRVSLGVRHHIQNFLLPWVSGGIFVTGYFPLRNSFVVVMVVVVIIIEYDGIT